MGLCEFTVKLLESRIVTRDGHEAAAGQVGAQRQSDAWPRRTELANEMLNEAQRTRGGEVVREDESRYLATHPAARIRPRPGAAK